jgi:hypothetical protein
MCKIAEGDMSFIQFDGYLKIIHGYEKILSGWKPTHLTSLFSLQTSIFTSPHGTMLTAFADVKNRCLRMLDEVGFHPP